jgi:hypothetical protein
VERSPERICAFESHRYTDLFDTVGADRKTVTRLVKSQFLDEIGRGDAKFQLESTAKVPGTETRFGR